MSWQRVLELARRRGLPLIVTDPAGREPLAILSLEEYERLTETVARETPTASSAQIPVRIERREPTTVPVSSPEVSLSSLVQPPASLETLQQEIPSKAVSATVPEGEMSLEERFYLEPVEDGQD